jgi:hypothetical protein
MVGSTLRTFLFVLPDAAARSDKNEKPPIEAKNTVHSISHTRKDLNDLIK